MPEPLSPEAFARFLPVSEFAARQGVSEWTVREWTRRHGLPHVKFGSRILIPPDALERMLPSSASTGASTKVSNSGHHSPTSRN